jgi:hypothetical protein
MARRHHADRGGGRGIKGWIQKQVMKIAGAGPQSPHRITLLRAGYRVIFIPQR